MTDQHDMESTQQPSPSRKPIASSGSVMLTISEVERIRQRARESDAFYRREFARRREEKAGRKE